VVFWGRLVPGVRTFISVPAGIELMPQPPFLAWTTAGSSILVVILALAGQALGENYGSVLRWVEPISGVLLRVVLVTALALGLLLLLRRRRSRSR
jgi:membrane protein DedA with SNARE-associated domain